MNTCIQVAEEEKADITMCSYIREFGSHSKEKKFDLPEKIYYQNEDVKRKVMRRLIGPLREEVANPELLDAWGTVWSKLYKSELIKKNCLQFIDLEEIGTNEDSLFNIQALYSANCFVFTNKPLYHYWRGNGTSVTSTYKPMLLDQWFNLYQRIEKYIEDKEDYKKALNNRICMNTLGLGLNTVSKNNPVSTLKKIQSIKKILNDQRISRSFSQLELSYFPAVWRTFYYCAQKRFATGFFTMLIAINLLRKTV